MSTPVVDQQPPPVVAVTQQVYNAHSDHGSVGPVIAVLAVITILGVIAGMIGRLCSGRGIMGHGQYDFEGWVERKCSSCLDGNIDHPPPPQARPEIPVAQPVLEEEGPQQEIKEEEQKHEHEPEQPQGPQPQPQPQPQVEAQAQSQAHHRRHNSHATTSQANSES